MTSGARISVDTRLGNACSGHGRAECKYTAKAMHHVRTAMGNSRGLVAWVRTTGHVLNPKGGLDDCLAKGRSSTNTPNSSDARRRARLISVSVGAPSRFRQTKVRLVSCGFEAIRSIHNYLPVLSADFETGSRFGSWSAVSTALLLHGDGKTNSRAPEIASSYEPSSTAFDARAFGHRTDG
jgi:hypothetical protein